MKYELYSYELLPEKSVLGENNQPTDEYQVNIQIWVKPVDGIAPIFTKEITVVSHNSQTGFEVDEQRQSAIENFINGING